MSWEHVAAIFYFLGSCWNVMKIKFHHEWGDEWNKKMLWLLSNEAHYGLRKNSSDFFPSPQNIKEFFSPENWKKRSKKVNWRNLKNVSQHASIAISWNSIFNCTKKKVFKLKERKRKIFVFRQLAKVENEIKAKNARMINFSLQHEI